MFGFDAFKYETFKYDYLQAAADYIVPYRSLPVQTVGTVKATLISQKYLPAKVTFKTKDGTTKLDATNTGNEWTITLPKGPEGRENVYAIYDDGTTKATIGKLVVERYTPKPYKVKVIAVNGAAQPTNAKTELDKIYEPAQVTFDVSTDNFSFDLGTDGLSVGDNATLSSYTTEMNALKAAYFTVKPKEKDIFYVFVVPNFDKSGVLGYMPRGKNMGFITATGGALAHELGHGAFGLEHTFDAKTSDNLMDYSGGQNLVHNQWTQIRNPGLVINWLDDAEDGMSKQRPETICLVDALPFKGKVFKTTENTILNLRPDESPMSFDKNGNMYSFRVGSKEFVPWRLVKDDSFYCYAPDDFKTGQFADIDQIKYKPIIGANPETVLVNIATYKITISAVVVDGKKCSTNDETINCAAELLLVKTHLSNTPGTFAYYIIQCPASCLKTLGMDVRVSYLNELSTDLKDNEDTQLATIKLLETIQLPSDYEIILTKLKSENLLSKYLGNFDEETTIDLAYLINAWTYIKAYSIPVNDSRIIYEWGREVSNFQTTGPITIGADKTYGAEITSNLVKISAMNNVTSITMDSQTGNMISTTQELSIPDNSPPIDPYQIVEVRMIGDFSFGLETIFKKDTHLRIPAIMFYALIKQKKARDLSLQIKMATIAVTAPTMGAGGWAGALAILDNTTLGADILINDANVNAIKTNHPVFANAFNNFKYVYFAARATQVVVATLEALAVALSNLKAIPNLTQGESDVLSGVVKMINGAKNPPSPPAFESLGFNTTRFAPSGDFTPPSNSFMDFSYKSSPSPVFARTTIVPPLPNGTFGVWAEVESVIETNGKVIPLLRKAVNTEIAGLKEVATANVYKLVTNVSSEPDIITLIFANGTKAVAYCSSAATTEADNQKNNCNYCRVTNKPLCIQLKSLSQSTGNDLAVKKLCNSSISDLNLLAITTKLNTYVIEVKKLFLSDIADPCGTDMAYLCKNIAALNGDLVDAWKIVYDARGTTGNHRKDFGLLSQTKDIVSSNELDELGGKSGLIEIITKNTAASCNTCTTGPAPYLNKMDVYLGDVKYFVEKYGNIDGAAGSVLAKQGIKNAGRFQVEATAFMLRVLHENPSEFENKIAGFEISTGVGRRKMDIRKSTGVFVECKSWDDNADTFADFAEGAANSSSYPQFLAYLQAINDMNELEYWLDKRKLTGGDDNAKLTTAKNKFQQLFLLTDSNGKNIVFEKIWANTGLRGNLFPINNTDALKGAAFNDFKLMISSLDNNKYYNYIFYCNS